MPGYSFAIGGGEYRVDHSRTGNIHSLSQRKEVPRNGLFFNSVKAALYRNKLREGKERIKDRRMVSCYKKLARPTLAERFDELFYVYLHNDGFLIDSFSLQQDKKYNT